MSDVDGPGNVAACSAGRLLELDVRAAAQHSADMARLVTVRCPNCGAHVRLVAAAEWVTCDYCKTESFVHRPKAPPPPVNVPVIELAPTPSGGGRALALGIVLLGAGAIAAVVALSFDGSLSDVALQSPALLFDVNRDGAADALVAAMATGQVQQHVRALDALTGETLWQSEELGDARNGLEFALSADAVLVFNGPAVLALDARSGKQRFSKALPERVEAVCEGDSAAVLLLTDQRRFALDVKSAALQPLAPATRPADEGKPWCSPTWGTFSVALGQQVRELPWRIAGPQNMLVDDRLQHVASRSSVLTGKRSKGSAVPELAGLGETDFTWHTPLPKGDPLQAKEGDPSGVTLTSDTVYAAYSFAQRLGFAVVARSLSDGKLHWETEIPRKRDPGSVWLSADDRHVFVIAHSAIHGLSARDGKVLWSLGWGLDL